MTVHNIYIICLQGPTMYRAKEWKGIEETGVDIIPQVKYLYIASSKETKRMVLRWKNISHKWN